MGGDQLVRDFPGSREVEIGNDDVRPAGRQLWAVARPMPLAPPVMSATRPASSPRAGACASLYRSSGQYSIANASASLSERKPPSASAASWTAIARW